MKILTVVSGKGGTGKTTIVTSFASLAKREGTGLVLADCDVDAADLNILLQPVEKHRELFTDALVAEIDQEKCIACGKCLQNCRFDAVENDGDRYDIDYMACEGCGVCDYVCPADAIIMKTREGGYWFISDTPYGPIVHARLAPGEGNSGKLVTVVRQTAEQMALELGLPFVLIDGPPGMGCPVIASVTNTDLVIIVTEPTLSGLHDMERVVGLCMHFGVKPVVCINKYDLNLALTREIESMCAESRIEMVGKIPYDERFTKALVNMQPAVDHIDGNISLMIQTLWKRVKNML
jgi:MinD superfamily P-loop ATPase